MATTHGVPESASEMLEIARTLLLRFKHSQEFQDLYGAVISAAHMADWHFSVSADEQLTDRQKLELKGIYKEYDTLMDLANALKHGLHPRSNAATSEARRLVLKRIDAWGGDDEDPPLDGWDHLGGPDYWIVRHGENRHSVFILCEKFLQTIQELTQGASSSART